MSVLPILPRGFVVGRILSSRGDSADADKFPDTAVVVGMVDFTPATPYRKLDAFTVVTHSKITAKLDSHGDLHPQRETSDNTGSDTEDGIWLPTGKWKVTYRLNTGFGALPEHNIEVDTAHTEAAPLPLFANLGDPAPAGATLVQLTVPIGGQQGQVLVMNDGSLSWGDMSGGAGMTTEGVRDIVGSMVAGAGGTYNDTAGTITLPGGGSSTIAADDTPAAPAEGESASYFVTSAVTWPAGLVWSTDPDGGTAPTITDTALVSLFTVGGVTRAIMGATFPAPVVPDVEVTAAGPTWTDDTAAGGGTWATPTETGVTYSPASGTATAGQAVTVTATATSGYTITGTASWSHTFPIDTTAPAWTATFTLGTPTTTAVVATASALATDAAGVTGYQVSYDGGTTPASIVPSGSNFTLAGSAGTTYATTKLRARDAAGNPSTWLDVPSYTMAASSDVTNPTVGTMAASAITSSGFTLTVSGAADAGGLHAQPYAFTTDGTNYGAYQASPVYTASGLAASTGYSCNWRVRDAAGNVSTGTAQTVTTSEVAALDGYDWEWRFESDSITGLSDGADVATWPDTSGNGRDATQATAEYRPVWDADAFGIIGGVAFTAKSEERLITPAITALTQPTTVWYVGVPAEKVGSLYDGLDSSSRHNIYRMGTTDYLFAGSSPSIGGITQVRSIIAVVFNGASSIVYKGNGIKQTVSAGTHALTGLTIGNRHSGAESAGRTIGALLVTNEAQPVSDINVVGAALAAKYGLTWTAAT